MKISLSIALVVCGTVLIVSVWLGVAAQALAMGNILAARTDLTKVSLGGGEAFGVVSSAVGLVMIIFACWKSERDSE